MRPSGVAWVFTAKRSNKLPGPARLAEKLDRNLRGNFANSVLHLFGRLCETVRIDVDSDATIGTDHTLLRLQSSNGLAEIMPAVGALESNFVQVHVGHQTMPVPSCALS
jgi:hypothetical protein